MVAAKAATMTTAERRRASNAAPAQRPTQSAPPTGSFADMDDDIPFD